MEPRRLLDDNPSEIERALLNAGTAYRCSNDSRTKTLAALGLAGSAAVSAAAIGVSATSLVAKLGWTKLILAMTAIGVMTSIPVGLYVWRQHHPTQPSVVAERAVVAKPVIASAPAAAPVDATPVERSQAAEAPADTAVHAALPPKAEAKPDSSSPLSEELSALDSVRALLARGDTPAALSRLDSYNRDFAKGRLQLEAEVLRIDALMKSGQSEQAKARAQAFLTRHPNSVLATRVRSLLH